MAKSIAAAPFMMKVLEIIDEQHSIVGAKVYYRDSEQQWDELKIDDRGKFLGFGPMTTELRAWCAEKWAS